MKINGHYKNRYDKLINYRKINISTIGENHHIIPVCMSGSNSKENIVKLPYREHFIAHYLLAKSYPDESKLWYAFNMMKRVCDGKSILYEKCRRYISKIISNTNTGRIKTQSEKNSISERTRKTVVVKDKFNNMFRVSIKDPRYLSGELVFYRTGMKHNQKTIDKMKKNGIKDRKMYYNIDTGHNMFYNTNDAVLPGYIEGSGPRFKDRALKRKKTSRWFNNPLTQKNIRIGELTEPPEGFVKGRIIIKDENGKFKKSDC